MAEAIIEGKAVYAEANGEDVNEVSATEMENAMAEAATEAEVEKLAEEKSTDDKATKEA
jgi:small subunit ribosomal protein S2